MNSLASFSASFFFGMASKQDTVGKVESGDPVVSLCEAKISDDEALMPMTAEEEKALVRKIDRQ